MTAEIPPEITPWRELRRRDRVLIVAACILVGLSIPFYVAGWILTHV